MLRGLLPKIINIIILAKNREHPIDQPEAFIAVKTHHCVFSILQQESIITLLMLYKRELVDWQRPYPFPVCCYAAQMAVVVMPVVLPFCGAETRTLSFISGMGS